MISRLTVLISTWTLTPPAIFANLLQCLLASISAHSTHSTHNPLQNRQRVDYVASEKIFTLIASIFLVVVAILQSVSTSKYYVLLQFSESGCLPEGFASTITSVLWYQFFITLLLSGCLLAVKVALLILINGLRAIKDVKRVWTANTIIVGLNLLIFIYQSTSTFREVVCVVGKAYIFTF